MISVNYVNQYDESNEYKKTIVDIIQIAYDYFKLTHDLVINIILVNNLQIQKLNEQYRGLNQPTDVLSFDNQDLEDELGDVFISIDKVQSQAKAYGHSFERELAFLTLHGFLHCMGYDHIDQEDEIKMFHIQDDIIENSKFRREEHYEK
jgi:probable rRNA maturation factor